MPSRRTTTTNGQMQFVPSDNPTFTYGDAYADELAGNLSNYNEQNFNRINDISYNTYEGFIQDSWKVTSRLTVEARSAHDALHALDRPRRLRILGIYSLAV